MNEVLTYEEWRDRYANTGMSAELRNTIMALHGLSPDDDIEQLLVKEYEMYVSNRTKIVS